MSTYFDIRKMVEDLEEAKDRIVFLQTILGQNVVYVEGEALQLDDNELSGLGHVLHDIIVRVANVRGCIVVHGSNDDTTSDNSETSEEVMQ